MSAKNTSDIIEKYLKQLLDQAEMIEIQRREMAEKFDVVPSAINYVINTRFTIAQGYEVISKRGGGGFIRIVKVIVSNEHQFICHLQDLCEKNLYEKDAISMVQKLYEKKLVTEKEGNLMLCALTNIENITKENENSVRANLMNIFLERLSYEQIGK